MPLFKRPPSTLLFRLVLAPLSALLFSGAMAQPIAPQSPAATAAQAEPRAMTPVASAILAREPGGTLVSVADVLSELRRAPVSERQTILSKPEMVQQIASNLLVRRVLAAEAERDGLGADPVVLATLAIARDRVLSDARLAQLDAQNTPNEATLEAYARNIYQANTAKFEKPAQTRARHILLANNGPESLRKANELLAQLRSGASFEELAKANSIDPGSAVRGGDLGFFGAGKMVQPFEEAVDKLGKAGDLSEPVVSEFGIHIIRLEERREKSVQTYDQLREQLRVDARMAILNESRVQKALALTKSFVFDLKVIEASGNPPTK